jgi:hypothetical protein
MTTVFVGSAVALFALWAADAIVKDLSTKAIGAIVFGLGWAACMANQREIATVYATERTKPRSTTGYAVGTSVLGAVALIAGIVAVFTGNEPFVVVLLGAMVALWLAATARHGFGWWMKTADDPEVPLDRAA